MQDRYKKDITRWIERYSRSTKTPARTVRTSIERIDAEKMKLANHQWSLAAAGAPLVVVPRIDFDLRILSLLAMFGIISLAISIILRFGLIMVARGRVYNLMEAHASGTGEVKINYTRESINIASNNAMAVGYALSIFTLLVAIW